MRHCFPHTRGDGPASVSLSLSGPPFSPHTWGWSGIIIIMSLVKKVFPTHVGMVRGGGAVVKRKPGFPHTRGDGPVTCQRSRLRRAFSPHTWGWSACFLTLSCSSSVFPTHVGMVRVSFGIISSHLVFPTHVGMVRSQPHHLSRRICFPHTRGDGPLSSTGFAQCRSFSPHTWGWSAKREAALAAFDVFPTHVGMVRSLCACLASKESFPHTRGDGPATRNWWTVPDEFSPHTWGWSA